VQSITHLYIHYMSLTHNKISGTLAHIGVRWLVQHQIRAPSCCWLVSTMGNTLCCPITVPSRLGSPDHNSVYYEDYVRLTCSLAQVTASARMWISVSGYLVVVLDRYTPFSVYHKGSASPELQSEEIDALQIFRECADKQVWQRSPFHIPGYHGAIPS
jgi:hypothetical protein